MVGSSSAFRYFEFLRQRRGASGRAENPSRRGRSLRDVRDWFAPQASEIGFVVLLAGVATTVDMVWPLASLYLIDHVLLHEGLGRAEKVRQLVWFCCGAAALFGTNSLLNLWRGFRSQLLASKLALSLRRRLFERVLRLPLAEVGAMKTGGVLSRLSSDVESATSLLHQAVLTPLVALLRLSLTVFIIFRLEARIAGVVLLSVPPILVIQHAWTRRMRVIWKSVGEDRQRIDARVNEALGGLRVVRGFSGERREERSYVVGNHTVIRKEMLATGTQRVTSLIWDLIMPLAQVAILGYGGYLLVRGETTVGTLVAFQGYLWRLLEPVMHVAGSISETQRGFAALERVSDVLDRPAEKPDRPDAREARAPLEELHFEAVDFAYEAQQPVLSSVDFRVRAGSVVALVGSSGAGKTTLTDLLARFHDPSAGRITLDGTDIRDFRLKSYRALFGIVEQEVFLFDGTIAENIAYARPGASREAIEDAARRAHAHEFIERLPGGYATFVGERGLKLSGGQRQRLSIARALLADPAILILDEATSNLDSESEAQIQAGMQELVRRRTTFVIAHRLSTIRSAELIVVLERGRVHELGTHDELMRRGGRYRAMVELQERSEPDAGRSDR